MISYNINGVLQERIHEFELSDLNQEISHQLIDMLINILGIKDGNHKYILIDVAQFQLLSFEALVFHIKDVLKRHSGTVFYVALVVDNQMVNDENERVLQTILRRGNIEIFTDIDKAYLWLKYQM